MSQPFHGNKENSQMSILRKFIEQRYTGQKVLTFRINEKPALFILSIEYQKQYLRITMVKIVTASSVLAGSSAAERYMTF